MTTTVTEQEKREALARWEGWEGCSQGHWYRPAEGSCAAQGGIVDLPDYFHDGNAMLRLLGRVEALEWGWEIYPTSAGCDVLMHPGEGTTSASCVLPSELPAAVAEAVYEAITGRALTTEGNQG